MASKLRKAKVSEATNVPKVDKSVDAALRVLHRIFLQKTREEIVRSKAAAAASKSRGTSLKAKGDRERARKKVTGTDVIEGAEVVWKKVQESKKEGRRARSNQSG